MDSILKGFDGCRLSYYQGEYDCVHVETIMFDKKRQVNRKKLEAIALEHFVSHLRHYHSWVFQAKEVRIVPCSKRYSYSASSVNHDEREIRLDLTKHMDWIQPKKEEST
jgi:hypothetical protein